MMHLVHYLALELLSVHARFRHACGPYSILLFTVEVASQFTEIASTAVEMHQQAATK